MSIKGAQIFDLACQGERPAPFPPCQLRHWLS